MKNDRTYLLLILLTLSSCIFLSCADSIDIVKETWGENQPKKIITYKNPVSDSIKIYEKSFYENGNLQYEGGFTLGLKTGSWVYHYKNGSKWSLGEFLDGKRQGITLVYYENGKLRYEGQYDNSMPIGHWSFYNDTGELIKEVDYKGEQENKAR